MTEIDYASVPAGFKGRNIIGERFSRLLVVSFSRRLKVKGGTRLYWNCVCDCGKTCEAQSGKLTTGHTNSCGCYQQQRAKEAKTIHGCAPRNNKKHPAYESHRGAKERCSNPNHIGWRYYGGNGITMCVRWRKFINFRDDMISSWFEGATIDRIDYKGHYSCGKCDECLKEGWAMNGRWATWDQQMRNRSDNVWITFRGETLVMNDWAERYGISHGVIATRLDSGWPLEDVFLQPVSSTPISRRSRIKG